MGRILQCSLYEIQFHEIFGQSFRNFFYLSHIVSLYEMTNFSNLVTLKLSNESIFHFFQVAEHKSIRHDPFRRGDGEFRLELRQTLLPFSQIGKYQDIRYYATQSNTDFSRSWRRDH